MASNFKSVDPRDIRSEPNTFEQLGIRQMNRIAELSQSAVGTFGLPGKYGLLSLEGAVRAFNAFLMAEDNACQEKLLAFEKQLKKDLLDDVDNRFKYFESLMKWFNFLASVFYSIANISPAKQVNVDFPGAEILGKKREKINAGKS